MTTVAARRWGVIVAVLFAAVIVPFLLFAPSLDAAAAWAAANGTGWAGALLLGGLLAGDILLPVPSSVVSTACGVILGFTTGTLVSTAGLTAGCLLGYGLGRCLSGPRLERLVTADGAARVSALAARHGAWALVLLRGVPVLAEMSVVMAGMTRMAPITVLPAVLLPNLGLSAAYAAAGAYAWNGGAAALLPFAAAIGLPAAARLLAPRPAA